MPDFMYDERGICVAHIIEHEFFAEMGGNRIATIRNGDIYALDGKLIGHVQSGRMVRGDGYAMPEALSKLIASSGKARNNARECE
jgi:hypothetical protein